MARRAQCAVLERKCLIDSCTMSPAVSAPGRQRSASVRRVPRRVLSSMETTWRSSALARDETHDGSRKVIGKLAKLPVLTVQVDVDPD